MTQMSADHRDRRQLMTVLGSYVILLVWMVVWKFQIPVAAPFDWRNLNLVPFHNAIGFSVSTSEVIANVLLFLPLGVLLRVLGSSVSRWQPLALIVGTSLLCEVLQLVFGVGSADTTDLITNSVGGVLGLVLIPARWTRGAPRRRLVTAAWVCLGVLVVAAVAIAIDPEGTMGLFL